VPAVREGGRAAVRHRGDRAPSGGCRGDRRRAADRGRRGRRAVRPVRRVGGGSAVCRVDAVRGPAPPGHAPARRSGRGRVPARPAPDAARPPAVSAAVCGAGRERSRQAAGVAVGAVVHRRGRGPAAHRRLRSVGGWATRSAAVAARAPGRRHVAGPPAARGAVCSADAAGAAHLVVGPDPVAAHAVPAGACSAGGVAAGPGRRAAGPGRPGVAVVGPGDGGARRPGGAPHRRAAVGPEPPVGAPLPEPAGRRRGRASGGGQRPDGGTGTARGHPPGRAVARPRAVAGRGRQRDADGGSWPGCAVVRPAAVRRGPGLGTAAPPVLGAPRGGSPATRCARRITAGRDGCAADGHGGSRSTAPRRVHGSGGGGTTPRGSGR